MRYIPLLVLLAAAPVAAQSNVQNVHEVATSTSSLVQTIDVSTTATDVAATTSSGTLLGYYQIEVYSVAGSTTINCGFDISVSTISTSAWYGREVAAGTGVTFTAPSYRKLYCRTQNATTATRATITQYK